MLAKHFSNETNNNDNQSNNENKGNKLKLCGKKRIKSTSKSKNNNNNINNNNNSNIIKDVKLDEQIMTIDSNINPILHTIQCYMIHQVCKTVLYDSVKIFYLKVK